MFPVSRRLLCSLGLTTLIPIAVYAQLNTLKVGRNVGAQESNTLFVTATALKVESDTILRFFNGSNSFDRSRAWRRALIAPVLLTSAGLSTLLDDDNDDDHEVQTARNRSLSNFRRHGDDYLQYAPIAAVYGLNLVGVKGKNDFANRTALLIKSELVVGVLTFSLKRIAAVPRPDTKEPTSFPSGHTAQAFAAATFMAREYGHKSIWYSIGAYTVATGVGAMRVMNNRHWLSDVLAGAGVGILSTNLVYLTHQYRWGKKNKVSQTIIVPSYDGQTGMVRIIHRFR